MNKPYVKKYDENGVCINPITRKEPYVNIFPNRQSRKPIKGRDWKNSKNVSRIVIKVAPFIYEVWERYFQMVDGKRIPHVRLVRSTLNKYNK